MNLSRVLFVISSLRSGGAEHHLLNLIRFLKEAGVEAGVCTISPVENELDSRVILDDIHLYRIPLRSLRELFNPSKLTAVSRVVSSFEPDLIHAHLYHAEVVAVLASVFSRVPIVVTRHSYGLEFNGLRRCLIRLLQRKYSAVIAVSEEIAEEASRMGYPPDRSIVIPNAVDGGRFRPLDPEQREVRRRELLGALFNDDDMQDAIVVGAVGGLKEVKNYPLFVRIASSLTSHENEAGGIKFRFLIIGEGPQRARLEELIEEEKLWRVFALPGYTDRVEELLPLLDILVVTSSSEGVPLSLLEAMACGVIPVSPDVGGVGGVMGDSGILLKDHSVDGYTGAILKIAGSSDLRDELSRRARRRVLERYDLKSWGCNVLDVYGKVLADKRVSS